MSMGGGIFSNQVQKTVLKALKMCYFPYFACQWRGHSHPHWLRYSKGGLKGLSNLVLLKSSEFEQYGFKNVRNVIEKALNCYFLPQNVRNHPATGGFAPRPPL